MTIDLHTLIFVLGITNLIQVIAISFQCLINRNYHGIGCWLLAFLSLTFGIVEDDAVIYSIKDKGVAYNQKYTHKLFGLFERLHKVGQFEGSGVGLAIVQRAVQRHGGEVWAESVIDQGATFYFTLKDA